MTNLTATFAAAVNTLLEEQTASDVTSIHEVNDSTIVTDVKYFDKEGDLIKRLFFFGTPETNEIEASCDLTLGSIIKNGGSKKYENNAVVIVKLRSIASIKEELDEDYRIGLLKPYSEKQVIKFFNKITK